MKRHITGILIAATLASLAIIPTTAVPVAAVCGSNTNQHIYVQRDTREAGIVGDYLEKVSGRVTIRALDSHCLTTGFNAVLPANLQRNCTPCSSGGDIWQLGYWRDAGSSAMKFVYAYKSPVAINWSDTFLPVVGEEYRFEIGRGDLYGYGGGDIVYRITRIDNGATSTKVLAQTWYGSMTKAWWGGERGSTTDDIGPDAGETPLIVRYMCYQSEDMSGCTYRSGLSNGEIHNSAASYNHGHIVDWTYGEDGLQLETH